MNDQIDLEKIQERVSWLKDEKFRIFREIIISQPRYITRSEYFDKVVDWLRLLEMAYRTP